jgi:3-hydroxyacyl-CoA dehydrogenase/enoyl-CoA hydratase/3-hydroxybutyryl-CoA epimerase
MDSAVRTLLDSADNVLTVVLDVPGKPVNTCTPQLLAELAAVVESLEKSATRPAGVIIASAKARSFNAGADLFTIRDMEPEQIGKYLAEGQALFDRIARLPMPSVAAINGDCLGGGMELALACTYRVAADDFSINVGLPETKLGLIPAWGGATRLPRMIGLTKALPILIAGKTMPPRKARKAGLVDEVVRPEALLAAARRIVLSKRKRQRPGLMLRVAAKLGPARNKILTTARRQTVEKTFDNYPAPLRLLDVVKTGYEQGMHAGLAAEREAILGLTQAEATKNLLRVFFLRQGAKRRAGDQLQAKPADINHAAVVGGGTMGAGIVHALIRAGIPVRLVEVNPAAASAALGRISKLLDDDVASGKLDKLAARHAFNRVTTTTDWTGLGLADLVIEAVIETMAAKHEVFKKLDQLTRHDAILATNTSSLRVSEIAQAVNNPGRVIGLHFFNPVNKMPLVEIVRGPRSDDAALASGVGLVNRIGKTPVVVADAPGFLVNRLLIPHLLEALAMAVEGVPILTIDEAVKKWGMPMGPFELLDEIGLDIGIHVLKSLSQVQANGLSLPAAVEQAVAKGWLGKKSGTGFYIHEKSKKRGKEPKLRLNEEMAQLIAPKKPESQSPAPATTPAVPLGPSHEEIAWRLILPMVNEAARTLEEGITDSADDIDLATVFGLGFAPFRGGLAKFIEDAGVANVVHKLEELAAKHGPRFAPAPLLKNGGPLPRPKPAAKPSQAAAAVVPALQPAHS